MDMKVVFLCGGIGKRMSPITQDRFLLPFLGRTLLEHQVETAREAGLDRFLVIGNPANIKQIEQVINMTSGVKIERALQEKPLGIADALKSAESFLNGDIVVVNPNDVCTVSAYNRLLQERQENSADSYILGYKVKGYFPGGYLAVDSTNQLKHIVEKPQPGQEPSHLVTILVHLHAEPRKLLEYIENVETTRDDAYERALDDLIKGGHRIKVVPYTDSWAPMKYPWHILDVVKYFLNRSQPHISASASISEKATIEGEVTIDDNVRVLENAVIRGPVYVGPNSMIGGNVLVRDYSHIGADCVLGYGTEVKSSYIGDGCWLHASYIGDSIIGKGCSFGAGTVLANFRFDEQNVQVRVGNEAIDTGRDKLGAMIGDNCKTGVNASVMPGMRIGPNSIVGPNVCLTKDLEPGKTILAEPRYRVLPNRAELDEAKKRELKEKLDRLGGET